MKGIRLHTGDCLAVLPTLEAGSVDAVITDPPYVLGFMGKEWDRSCVAFQPETWVAVANAVKPGGYLLSFGGTRTYHRLVCAIEDAGWEIRDTLMWVYGSGFPKGQGCLKPAWEPIVLARKPGAKVLPLGIDECRVPGSPEPTRFDPSRHSHDGWRMTATGAECADRAAVVAGRYPANLVHDGSDEVMEAFAAFGEKTSGSGKRRPREWQGRNTYGFSQSVNGASDYQREGDTGTASRFFYCAKAPREERGEDNNHPTVKPLALMRWLLRLVCSPGGTVLDPFMGSGTTAIACMQEGRHFTGIERMSEYVAIAEKRIAAEQAKTPLFQEVS